MAKEFVKVESVKKLNEVLVDNVNEQRLTHQKNFKERLNKSLIDCESPIEQLFAMELENYDLSKINIFNKGIKLLKYAKQENFMARNEKTSRLDFYFEFLFTEVLDSQVYKFAIELDGKKYHDKDDIKEIEKRRWIANSLNGGLIVFQGHEVFYKSKECVEKFITDVLDKYEQYKSSKNIFRRNGFGDMNGK